MADDSFPATPLSLRTSDVPTKTSKRRSMLIQPGTIVAATRKASGEPNSPMPPTARPVTMFNPNISSFAELAAQFGDDTEAGAERASEDESGTQSIKTGRALALSKLNGQIPGSISPKRAVGDMAPPPKPTSRAPISRSQSLRKPAPLTDSQKGGNPLSHSRVMSTNSKTSRPLSTLQESTTRTSSRSSRPVSSASTASAETLPAPTRERQSSVPQPTGSSSSNLALRRATSTSKRHTRAQSALPPSGSTTSTPSALPRLELGSHTRRRPPPISSGSPPPISVASSNGGAPASLLQRPAFTTLQQHYSPRKNLAPKPLTSSIMNASPTSESSGLSLETQVLQAQLLQLCILHKQFGPTNEAYIRSAHKKLGKKFAATAAQSRNVQEEERKLRIRKNVAALKLWGASADGKDTGFGELLQTLASVVNEASLLAEEGGRVEQVTAEFERWQRWIEEIWSRRKSQSARAEAEFIDGLGEAWKAEMTVLIRRLGGLKRLVEVMPPAKKGSSLEQAVRGSGELVDSMLSELTLLVDIEAKVVEQEKRWVDEQIAALAGDIGIAIAAG